MTLFTPTIFIADIPNVLNLLCYLYATCHFYTGDAQLHWKYVHFTANIGLQDREIWCEKYGRRFDLHKGEAKLKRGFFKSNQQEWGMYPYRGAALNNEIAQATWTSDCLQPETLFEASETLQLLTENAECRIASWEILFLISPSLRYGWCRILIGPQYPKLSCLVKNIDRETSKYMVRWEGVWWLNIGNSPYSEHFWYL